ncbi:cytochrome c oxidase subunit II [Candidatus Endowatersipora endosymbiont of Watersipora subatra]|uniref:cytochrome c oxidase subunit II n=1 Tax=Candidatus Endowatersipora endosymbiont of Watersipora subatra TaxID=3077946 RepID=UPI00312CA919
MKSPITKFSGLSLLSIVFTCLISARSEAGQPLPWQIWMQSAASPNMEAIERFNILTLYIIIPIILLVMGLLAYVMIKFRASSNPEPSQITHNTIIEILWTLGPVVLLVFLAIPSFQLLSSQFHPSKEPTVTIKATGYQWYWGFEYQDDPEISFETRLIGRDEGSPDSADKIIKEREEYGKNDLKKYPRLLAVDKEIVVPVGEVVRLLVTSGDVIHSFALPAFGLKMDGIPGRINETFFQATKEGLYYGQCSELCGRDHAFMPLAIRVVSFDKFEMWKKRASHNIDAANKLLVLKKSTRIIEVAAN